MKVLVVEDEHKIANTLKKGLVQENFIVDVTYDGEAGYDLASSETYDIILLDLMLPKMDGVTVCKKLREQGVHTPILMLTAKGEVSDKVFGLTSGADDYLSKPFSFSELLARIRALSRRPKRLKKETLKVDGLKLDTASFEVERNGKKINLSKKEFSLLEYLMRFCGKVLTKDSIISNVWSYEADVLPNTVEVYIGYLRNKIDKPFKSNLIKTIRGFGYKIG